ncbi:hypothetical protein BC332_03468 [Capsicum chinense]|nr:hypothetical protein BC332_03468 [Capsicum chinense]
MPRKLLHQSSQKKEEITKKLFSEVDGTHKEQETQQEEDPPESSEACNHNGSNGILNRCLVGCFAESDELPTRNDVRRWAQQTWKGIHNLQIFDLNGIQFLFEFRPHQIAEHILGGSWKRRDRSLKLEWWSPTVGAYPTQAKFDWFWIRALGLPLQLWSEKVMKQIGDECGGWLETEEETMLKNHLRWARIKAPARYRKVNGGKLVQREERDKIWKEALKMKETKYERGKRSVGEYPLDIEERQAEDKWGRAKSVARESGSTRGGSKETPGMNGLKILLPKDLYKSVELDGQNIGPCFKPNLSQATKIKTVEPFTKYIHSQQKNTVDNQDFFIFADELEAIRITEENQREGSLIQYMESQNPQGEKEIIGSSCSEIQLWEGQDNHEENPKQMLNFNDIEPLQVDEPISEEAAKEKATLWIHSNVIKLGKKFGAAFEGCEEMAYELLLKIDQTRAMVHKQKGEGKQEIHKAVVPKEVRNLAFDMKFKEGEPRLRGRISQEVSHED